MLIMLEYRVWCENGDLLGYAEVYAAHFCVVEADENSGYAWFTEDGGITLSSELAAQRYALEWAEGYVAYWQDQCACDGNDCGVFEPHGIFYEVIDTAA